MVEGLHNALVVRLNMYTYCTTICIHSSLPCILLVGPAAHVPHNTLAQAVFPYKELSTVLVWCCK